MPQTVVASSLFSSLLRRKMSVLGFYSTTLEQLLISSALFVQFAPRDGLSPFGQHIVE